MGYESYYDPVEEYWARRAEQRAYEEAIARQQAAQYEAAMQSQGGGGGSNNQVAGTVGKAAGIYAGKKAAGIFGTDAQAGAGATGEGGGSILTTSPEVAQSSGILGASADTAYTGAATQANVPGFGASSANMTPINGYGMTEVGGTTPGMTQTPYGAGGGENVAPSSLGTAAGAVGTAAGAYTAYQGVESGNPAQAGIGAVGAGVGLNAMGLALGPYGWAALVGVPIALAIAKGGTAVRDKANKRWARLQNESKDPNFKQAIGELHLANHPKDDDQIIKSGPLAGRRWKWEEVKPLLKAEDVWGTYGVLKTFKEDWLNKFSEDQRRQISQSLLDQDQFGSENGDIKIKDEKKAIDIAANVLGDSNYGADRKKQIDAERAAAAKSKAIARAKAKAGGD